MMRCTFAICVGGTLMFLSACRTDSVRADVPALISNPGAASRAELRRVVSRALNSSAVTIADDALTSDSLLIIEPRRLTGRELGRPEHFRLVLSGSACALVHEETKSRFDLTETECVAE